MQPVATGVDTSLLGLDGGNMLQAGTPGAIDTSLVDLSAVIHSPQHEHQEESLSQNLQASQTSGIRNEASILDGNAENLSIILHPTETIVPSNDNSMIDAVDVAVSTADKKSATTSSQKKRKNFDKRGTLFEVFDPNDIVSNSTMQTPALAQDFDNEKIIEFEDEDNDDENDREDSGSPMKNGRASAKFASGNAEGLESFHRLETFAGDTEEAEADSRSPRLISSQSGKISLSGAGTLVGDNMAVGDDPFRGRTNIFFGQSVEGGLGTQYDALKDNGDFQILADEDSDENRASIVSGQFGQLSTHNQIKTPGFNPDKKFSFNEAGEDSGNSDDIQKVQD